MRVPTGGVTSNLRSVAPYPLGAIVAKHHTSKKHGPGTALLAIAVAVGLSGVLALGHTTVVTAVAQLTSTVIGVGGRADPTSVRLENKLDGQYALGFDQSNTVLIDYPANLAFQRSINKGVPALTQAVADAQGHGDIRIVSYSEGTLVAEQVKRNLPDPVVPTAGDPTLDFVFIASPYLPNGGVFARFPGFRIPGLLPKFSAAQPTPYDSTYVTHEYDGYADFPAYFNPLAIANALLGMVYAHPDPAYDPIDLDQLVEGQTKFTTVVPDNGAGGRDTYILVYNPQLPLLQPIRDVAAFLRLTPLVEPVLDAIEPRLRKVIDRGYTDRINADPETPTKFSFFRPRPKPVAVADSTEAPAAPAKATAKVAVKPKAPAHSPKALARRDRTQIARPTRTSADKVSPARTTPSRRGASPSTSESSTGSTSATSTSDASAAA